MEPGLVARGDLSEAVGRLSGDPRNWLVGLDFDGTLAAIVARPEDAAVDRDLLPSLERLQRAVGTVAVISGRPRSFLDTQLPGVLALGSYGMELPPGFSHTGAPESFDGEAALDQLAAARRSLLERLPQGTRLESKPYGVVLHYRGADAGFDQGRALELMADVAREHHLELVRGRLVIELKPYGPTDKGRALAMLAERLEASAVVFVGDDLGDIPAWEATRQMSERIPALSVGIASTEVPEEQMAICDLVLADRVQLAALLDAVATRAELLTS
ncbi:MAG: trehalose-phosphatase [Candidatus Dormibacteria bacterium]